MFDVILSALKVPSTITEPSKNSTTKELKSAASASDAVAVAAAVYTLVPVFCALTSISVILSFGRIVLSAAEAITKAATSLATASVNVPVHDATSASLSPDVPASV